jgi:NAD+ diphosphatase
VREESSVEVAEVHYVASQPWPFPSSLMVGFHAVASGGGEPMPRDGELAEVRWFGREELEAAVAGDGDLRLPPPYAISRRLIDGWLAGQPRSGRSG